MNATANDLGNDPVYMHPLRKQARDAALYQYRMTGRAQYILQVNAREPGAGFEYVTSLRADDVVRWTDHVDQDGNLIDMTPLRGLAR